MSATHAVVSDDRQHVPELVPAEADEHREEVREPRRRSCRTGSRAARTGGRKQQPPSRGRRLQARSSGGRRPACPAAPRHAAATGKKRSVTAASRGDRLETEKEPFIAIMPPSRIVTTVGMPTRGATRCITPTTSPSEIAAQTASRSRSKPGSVPIKTSRDRSGIPRTRDSLLNPCARNLPYTRPCGGSEASLPRRCGEVVQPAHNHVPRLPAAQLVIGKLLRQLPHGSGEQRGSFWVGTQRPSGPCSVRMVKTTAPVRGSRRRVCRSTRSHRDCPGSPSSAGRCALAIGSKSAGPSRSPQLARTSSRSGASRSMMRSTGEPICGAYEGTGP